MRIVNQADVEGYTDRDSVLEGDRVRLDIRRVVRGITTTLLTTFAAGPAGRAHPARDNTAGYYQASR